MIFRRRHLQKNLIDYDDRILEYQALGSNVTDIVKQGKDLHGYAEEIFYINWIEICIDYGYPHRYDNKDISEIIESQSYITLINSDRKIVTVYKDTDITTLNFELTEPLP
jgi:hypothetical protein